MQAIDKLKVTQTSHGAMQVELERAMERSQEAMAQRIEYRRRRDAEKAALMPRVVRKVQMIDPESQKNWTETDMSARQRDSPNSGGIGQNSLNNSKSNISISSQDAVIEQLRQQHRQIVAEGRQRIIGNLVKHSMREVNQKQRYPFGNASVLSPEQQERQALRAIQQLKIPRKNSGIDYSSN